MTISLTQLGIVIGQHVGTHDNHKTKIYNRNTKTVEKGTQA